MPEPCVRVDVDRGVAVVTLDRPAVLNAFDARMGAEDAYLACDADDAVGAVVVTGAGRACCSGADLSPGAAVFGAVDATTFRSDPFTVHAWDVRKPVVAAMNGHAIGLALTLAL
jgi:enoyl-CoA hydratase/carnithine racemase